MALMTSSSSSARSTVYVSIFILHMHVSGRRIFPYYDYNKCQKVCKCGSHAQKEPELLPALFAISGTIFLYILQTVKG